METELRGVSLHLKAVLYFVMSLSFPGNTNAEQKARLLEKPVAENAESRGKSNLFWLQTIRTSVTCCSTKQSGSNARSNSLEKMTSLKQLPYSERPQADEEGPRGIWEEFEDFAWGEGKG